MAADDEVCGTIIICAGPPVCLLMGEDAIAAANSGCPWCSRVTVFDDGTESRTGPSCQ